MAPGQEQYHAFPLFPGFLPVGLAAMGGTQGPLRLIGAALPVVGDLPVTPHPPGNASSRGPPPCFCCFVSLDS
jgi:hypothetical protein